ncbi:MAG: threonine synthase, partial [Christensenellales bacterium]
ASNVNNVLTDFFKTGEYNVNREFFKTMSPSMDILISSNLERLLFEFSGRNDALTAERMASLKSEGKYSVTKEELNALNRTFAVGYATEEETSDTIDSTFDLYDYLMDTHTGVAMSVYNDYVADTDDTTIGVVVSTANAYKFPCDVYRSLTGDEVEDAFKASRKLHGFTGEDVPEPLSNLDKKQVRFTEKVDKADIENVVLEYVKK